MFNVNKVTYTTCICKFCESAQVCFNKAIGIFYLASTLNARNGKSSMGKG
jgi:hypothetical protein